MARPTLACAVPPCADVAEAPRSCANNPERTSGPLHWPQALLESLLLGSRPVDAIDLDDSPQLSRAETVRYRGEIGGVRRTQRIIGLIAVLACGIALFWLVDNWSLGHTLYHAIFSIASVAACLGVGAWQATLVFQRSPREPIARVVEGEVRIDVDTEDLSTDIWVGEHLVVPPPHWRGGLRSGQFARVRIAAVPGSSHAVLLAIDRGLSANAEAERGLHAYPHGNPAAPWTLAVATPLLLSSRPDSRAQVSDQRTPARLGAHRGGRSHRPRRRSTQRESWPRTGRSSSKAQPSYHLTSCLARGSSHPPIRSGLSSTTTRAPANSTTETTPRSQTKPRSPSWLTVTSWPT